MRGGETLPDKLAAKELSHLVSDTLEQYVLLLSKLHFALSQTFLSLSPLRHPSLLLSDLSTNLLASAACPQPGTAAGASPLLFPEGRLPVGSVRLLLLGREGDPRP